MREVMKKNKGFSLIELMIVVAVIAILASVAIPSFNDYIKDARLQDVTGKLTSYEARMQRFYSNSGRTFTNANIALGLPDTSGEFYDISVVIQAGAARPGFPAIPGQAFTLTATAKGSQVGYTKDGVVCNALTIDNNYVRGPGACW